MTLAEFAAFMTGFARFHGAGAETAEPPSIDAFMTWMAAE